MNKEENIHKNVSELLQRLNLLYEFLEEEGYYTKSNTVGLAIDTIEYLRYQLEIQQNKLF